MLVVRESTTLTPLGVQLRFERLAGCAFPVIVSI